MRALPAFSADLRARRAKHADATCLHAVRYLRQQRFETLAPEPEAPAKAKPWWMDKDRVRAMTPERWRKGIGQYANGIWPVDKLGPPPGRDNCVVPADLLAELRLTERYTDAGIERRTWRVSHGSGHDRG